jgi:hypothetical protein
VYKSTCHLFSAGGDPAKGDSLEPENRTVDELLAALQVTIPFGVETGRSLATSSADVPPTPDEALDLALNRKYFAQSGARLLTITKDQMEALRSAGAAGKDVEVLRSFTNEKDVTFSDHCRACQRWIHLASTEHEGECFCGQRYRVAFDLSPDDWSLRQDMRCMDCGVELTMSLAGAGLNPWHPINGHQVQCDGCALKRLASQAEEAAARARVR